MYLCAHLLFQLSLLFVMLPLYTGAGSGRVAIRYRVQRNTGEFLMYLHLLACTLHAMCDADIILHVVHTYIDMYKCQVEQK